MPNADRKAVHQVIVGAAEGDAITSMALQVRDSLRDEVDSEIYARWVFSESLEGEIHLLDEIPGSHGVDLLLYHSSYGLPEVTSLLLSRSEPLAIAYHNITPWEFYLDYNPEFALGLHWGHHELEVMRPQVVLAMADSTFNAVGLTERGYSNIHIVPVGVDPSRLTREPTDSALLRNLQESNPQGYVLAVAQVLHHKRIEQLMEAVHLCNAVHGSDIGLVIAGVSRQPSYMNGLSIHAESLPFCRVQFLGAATDRELATAFRGASMFLGMSDHEGFCIPPLEAMSFGVPVIVKGVGAVPETVGGAGLVLPANASVSLAAEAIYEVATNQETRKLLINRGIGRVREIESSQPAEMARKLLLEVLR